MIIKKQEAGSGIISLLIKCGLLAAIMGNSGCAVPALLGVKSYESSPNGPTKIQFITGADFGISMHGIDEVEDRRGIKPSKF